VRIVVPLSMRLRILAYHAIADLSDDPVLAEYGVPPRLFEAQLDSLIEAGWSFVDLDAALAGLAGERELPRRALLLTFDDAYADLLEVACPIMAERGLPGVVFAVAGKLGGTNEWDSKHRATTLDLLDADGLRAVAAQGIEVGSHTVSHHPLTKVPESELEEEIAGSTDLLEQAGLPRPRVFSYPYGEWSPSIAAVARAAGYEASFTVEPGVVADGADPHTLPRIEVHASDTPRRLRRKLLTAGWPKPLRDGLLRLPGARVLPVRLIPL
jgi:peptidoglycan/xylan/chitin deacetylase (PgdA/CDA1 family)